MTRWLALLALVLASCAKPHWSATGNGGVPFDTAAKGCDYEAAAAVASIQDRSTAHFRRRGLFEKCMIARGFTVVYK